MYNTKTPLALGALLSSVALAACTATTHNPNLPVGEAAYAVIPANVPPPQNYIIRPLDLLSIRVFKEPDVSSDSIRVDEVGQIQLPLIGTVKVAGRNAAEVSTEIASLLGARYLVDPQVAVSVKEVAPSYVTVEGEVKSPGVYEVDRNATLLTAVARAGSPSGYAKLSEIVVFRTIDNQRMVARFNLKDIRTGVAPDPSILDGDIVMVGYSTTRGIMQDILRAAPLLNTFAVLNREF